MKCKNEKGIRKIWRAFWRENRKKNMFLYFLWEKAFSCHFGWLVSQSSLLTLSWGVCLRKSRASKIFTLCFISDMVWSEKNHLNFFLNILFLCQKQSKYFYLVKNRINKKLIVMNSFFFGTDYMNHIWELINCEKDELTRLTYFETGEKISAVAIFE